MKEKDWDAKINMLWWRSNWGNVIKLTNVDRQKTEIKDSEADNHESRYLFCLFLSTPKRQIVICQKLTYSKE